MKIKGGFKRNLGPRIIGGRWRDRRGPMQCIEHRLIQCGITAALDNRGFEHCPVAPDPEHHAPCAFLLLFPLDIGISHEPPNVPPDTVEVVVAGSLAAADDPMAAAGLALTDTTGTAAARAGAGRAWCWLRHGGGGDLRQRRR